MILFSFLDLMCDYVTNLYMLPIFLNKTPLKICF